MGLLFTILCNIQHNTACAIHFKRAWLVLVQRNQRSWERWCAPVTVRPDSGAWQCGRVETGKPVFLEQRLRLLLRPRRLVES
jgi:hypothetical protein